MKKNSFLGTFIIVVVSLFLLILVGFVFDESIDEPEYDEKADGFTINSYNVILDVQEDNKVNVTEEITVDWYETNHHGIYKFTPQWLQYTGQDGKIIKRKSIVKDLKAIGDKYTTDTVEGKARIKIGSASEYVKKGLKTYTITYTYDMGKDPFKGFDEFIFHAFGDFWGTEIKNASIEVRMPKSISECNINFFTDKGRKENVNDYVTYSKSGNMLYASFNAEKYKREQKKTLDKSLTVDIELPEGYFNGGSWNYGIASFICCVLVFIITFLLFLAWKKYGKDFAKREPTVEFYPPDNLSPAEIGYIYNNQQTNKKQTIALIISLAAKGYIKINELEKKKIQITNCAGIRPERPQSVESILPKRSIEVVKVKDADENLSEAAKTMMKHLFKGNAKKKTINSNINTFLNVRNELIDGKFIEIKSDNEDEILSQKDTVQEEYDKAYKEYNEKMEEYEKRFNELPGLNAYEQKVYNRLFESKDEIILSEHKTFYKAFNDIEGELTGKFKEKIDDKKAREQRGFAIIGFIVSILIFMAGFTGFEDLDPAIYIMYKIAVLCPCINFFLAIIMTRRTKYGEEIVAKVKGFRNFLETAEKEQLEDLVEKNPEYFYNILPYTYVLEISKKWIKKFENIPIPNNDMGEFDVLNMSNWDSFYNHVYIPTPTYSSSGSSCGGGCSSCGGGCSSCGGGGSW